MKTKILIGMLATGWLACTASAQITVGTVTTNTLFEPCGITADSDGNFYVADSVNNRIAKIDVNTGGLSTFSGLPDQAAGASDGPVFLATFSNPEGIIAATINGTNGLVVADTGNHTIRFVRLYDGAVTTIAGQPGTPGSTDSTIGNSSFRSPVGLALDVSNNLYIADSGNNAIRVIDLGSHSIATNVSVLNDANFTVRTLSVNTTFNQPNAVAVGDSNQLWVADTRNNAIKRITLSSTTAGVMTTLMGSNNRSVSGTKDNVYGASALFNGPRGLLWLGSGLLISDSGNHTLRLATNYAIINPTNYAVVTFAGNPGSSGFVDGTAAVAKFNSPFGMTSDPFGNDFLVADMYNNAIRRVQNGAILGPVSTPRIGWVDFDQNGNSILRTNAPFTFNNDVIIAIAGEQNTETFFEYGATPTNPLVDTVQNPSRTVGHNAPPYQDGMTVSAVNVMGTIASPAKLSLSDFVIKAIGIESGRQPSSIASARFIFNTANPQINGDNAANFTITDQTAGADLWYTTNGQTPTNNTSNGSIKVTTQPLDLTMTGSNLIFQVQAFRANYKPSSVVTNIFLATSYVPNQITFGFASGEASSDFIGSPGQIFYAPVTMTLLPNTKMYSLQFNLTATNRNGSPAITPGAVNFGSRLVKPLPELGFYEIIPPAMFVAEATNPPPSSEFLYDGTNFVSLLFVDTNNNQNLVGVGWIERKLETNLYNTASQDLITYSMPHDTIFNSTDGKVVPGSFMFLIPSSAVAGQTYQIQIARASATSDGIGAPDSDVNIQCPTNGSLTNGAINSIKIVTVGQRKYLVGDAYPFRWFNAGDFGDTNLDAADVAQVFQSAVYSLNYPPRNSDFYDVMDSCCISGADSGHGYLTNAGTAVAQYPLYDGSDPTINNIAFGDGVLDVSDVYVTFRRSLDPSLNCYKRFWTNNGVRGAIQIANQVTSLVAQASVKAAVASAVSSSVSTTNTVKPGVTFTAGDAVTGPGQTLLIPITAQVFGSYPLRVLMLNLTVEALDGSPAITNAVTFTPAGALGAPTLTMSKGPANYAAAWLNSSIAGLTGSSLIGTLQVTLPADAPTNSAYAVHFDHASGSPNGVSSFPCANFTGLITLADRSGSSWGDGIPDSWRLRYFGTVNNLLSATNADADADGLSNYAEYIAGTNPNDAKSLLNVSSQSSSAQGFNIHWPSIAGKGYVIESSPTVFGDNWTPIATNTGTGGDMQIQDSTGGQLRFYRVRVAQ